MTGRDDRGSGWLRDDADEASATLRRALDELAARPADEIAVRRVWSHVGAELAGASPARDHRRRLGARARWALAGVALGLAGAAATTFVVTVRPPRSTGGAIDDATADVAPIAVPAGNEGRAPRAFLRSPAVVRTAAGERLKVTLKGGAEVELEPESVVNVDGSDQPAVELGRVTLQVPKQEPGRRFVVAAGPYRIVVVGTRFSVEVSRRDVAVEVHEGVVEVWNGSRVVRLEPGQLWSAGRAASPEAASMTRGHRSVTAALAEAPARPARRDAWQPGLAAPVVARSLGAVTAPIAPAAAEPGRTAPVEGAPAPAAPPAQPAAPSASDPVREARAALAAGAPDRAAELLRRAALRPGATGENASYELGRVLRDQLLRPRDALGVWTDYRARHPRGLLRAEVDLSLLETYAQLGDEARARASAEAFLATYPRSERRHEVEALLAKLRGAAGR